MVLVCISLIINVVEHISRYLLAIWMSSLKKYLFSSSTHFLKFTFFIYFFFFFGRVRSQLQHAGSSLRHAVSFVLAHRLLSSCGVWVFSLQLCHVGSLALVVSCGFQGAWALQLWCTSSVVVVCRLSCPAACGSQFPNQGSNLRPLHWKADSLPLDHQGSPQCQIFFITAF